MGKFIAATLFLVFCASSFYPTIVKEQLVKPLPVKLYTDNNDGFIVIGHRGASAYYPENTMASFKGAYDLGAEMVELDILLSKDGVPVVIHDETLDRTTTGKGKVRDFTLEELKELDAGLWFHSDFKGEKIPTLEEVLNFAKGRVSVNIEIKTEAVSDDPENGIEEKALKLVEKFDMQDYVLFSSFDYRAIAHLRQLDDDISTALLYEKRQSSGKLPSELTEEYQSQAFNCSYRQFSKKWAEDAKTHDFPVFVYTVNERTKMERMIKRGAAGIFSDRPDVLKKAAESVKK